MLGFRVSCSVVFLRHRDSIYTRVTFARELFPAAQSQCAVGACSGVAGPNYAIRIERESDGYFEPC